MVKDQVKSVLHKSKSDIGGIIVAQRSLLDASIELESVKKAPADDLIAKYPLSCDR